MPCFIQMFGAKRYHMAFGPLLHKMFDEIYKEISMQKGTICHMVPFCIIHLAHGTFLH